MAYNRMKAKYGMPRFHKETMNFTKNLFDVVNEILPVDVGVQNDPEVNETDTGEQSSTDGVVMAQGELSLAHDRGNIQLVRLYNGYVRQQYEQIISYARPAAAAPNDALASMNQIVQKFEKQHREYGISAFQMIIILVIGISLSWIIT